MDARAIKILFTAYWGSGGWKNGQVSQPDFEYAKAQGLMFDRHTVTHDKLIRDLVAVRQATPLKAVAGGFLASLSTRELRWRSALGSYCHCAQLKSHRFAQSPGKTAARHCAKCDAGKNFTNEDLSCLNFERNKWGGIRFDDLLYNWFDLTEFSKETPPAPTAEDTRIFSEIVRMIRASGPKDRPGTLVKNLSGLLPGNKDEYQVLVEILALAGVLPPADRDTADPGDWCFAGQWRGSDGLDLARTRELFLEFMDFPD